MDEEMCSIDITLSDGLAQKLMALCAVTGEVPEEKIVSMISEALEGGEWPVVPGGREGEG